METINYKSLKGEDLYNYFIQDHPDKEYASIIALLPVATLWEKERAFNLLERSIAESKQFIAVYPGLDDVDTSEMELIGEIDDGTLHLFLKGQGISQ